MRIGIDASRANLDNKTGTEWYAFNLIEQFKKIIPSNFSVVLYSKEPLKNELKNLPKNWRNKVLSWPPRFLWTQVRLSFEMLKFWNRPDLLFIPAHTIPLIHPKKTILVAHDIGFEKNAGLYDKKNLAYHRWAMRYAIKHAYHIITVSNFSRDEIINFYHCKKNSVTAVYNGFNDLNKFLYPQNNSLILQNLGIKKPYLLFVGRLEQKKNIPKLIEAFAWLKNKFKIPHRLVLIGMPGFRYEDIIANINKFKIKNEVIELGYVEKNNLASIMQQADLFIFPSQYEGFGIPILEAMSLGTPVVCSVIPALQEIAGNAAQYFNLDSAEKMAEKIHIVLNDESAKKKLIEQGYQRIKLFSYKNCADNTWNIIKQYL